MIKFDLSHVMLAWIEPSPTDSSDTECWFCDGITAAALAHNAAFQHKPEFRYASSLDAMWDFIAVHWAEIIQCPHPSTRLVHSASGNESELVCNLCQRAV